MKLLILGGTRFLGRHVVDAALARGHAVTLFTRGQQPSSHNGRVVALSGNRDPRVSPGLAALKTGTWDAVVDTSGYVPRVVGASADFLVPRVARYLFVSSLSVYTQSARAGQDESAPLLSPVAPDNEDIPKNYGALKAACEAAVADRFDARATIVRPGLIVGPYDPTDRFSYWVARFVHPALLGDRPPRAVVPSPRGRAIQFVDARDLARWIIELLENDTGGTFNAVSPAGQWTMGDLIDVLREAAAPSAPEPEWVDEATLLAHRVEPWTGLPLWIPANDSDSAGFLAYDAAKAKRAGLRTRTLAGTVGDTAAWLAARDNADAWKNVLDAATERAILGGDTPRG